jgi:Family of unknown function (DUF6504)
MLSTPGEPVEVWLTDGRPGRFVWRGRMYTVMLVLEYEPGPQGASDSGPGDPGASDPGASDPGASDPGASDRGRRGRGRAGAGRECWRVEATPLRAVPPAAYELCRDIVTDRWSLQRI